MVEDAVESVSPHAPTPPFPDAVAGDDDDDVDGGGGEGEMTAAAPPPALPPPPHLPVLADRNN